MNRMKCLGVLLAITLLAGFIPTFANEYPARAEEVVWEKYAANPVLENAPVAAEASVLYDEVEDLYKMWYTKDSKDFVSFNTLVADIITAAGDNLTNHVKDFNIEDIATYDAAKVKDVINHVATAVNIADVLASLGPRIAYATSADGITWNKVNDNVFAGGTAYGASSPSVIKEASGNLTMWYTSWNVDILAIEKLFDDINTLDANDLKDLMTAIMINKDLEGALDLLDAGFATDIFDDIMSIIRNLGGSIGRATSADGIAWVDTGVVLQRENIDDPDGADYWDVYGVYFPSVVQTAADKYEMWYTGFKIDLADIRDTIDNGGISLDELKTTLAASVELQIGHATSMEGQAWVKTDTKVPALGKNFAGAPDEGNFRGVVSPEVLVDSVGTYHMWYTLLDGNPTALVDLLTGSGTFGSVISSTVNSSIWYATSPNGTAWTSEGQALAREAGTWEAIGVAAPAVIRQGSQYMMWYTGVSSTDPVAAFNSLLTNKNLVTALNDGATKASIGLATYETGESSVITVSAIQGVTPPVTGATPATMITETNQFFGAVTWTPDDVIFKGSTVYTATIAVTPKTGFTLTGVPANFFTVAGAVAVNAANSGTVTAVFPQTAAHQLESLVISPYDGSVALGYTLPMTATGVYNDLETIDLTGDATWTSDNAGIATVNDTDNKGLVTTVAQGATVIRAAFNALAGNATLTVTAPVLKAINIVGDTQVAAGLQTAALTINGTKSDNTFGPVAAGIIWTSLTPTTANVSPAGVVTGLKKGTATIKATVDGFSDTHEIQVLDPVLQNITVLPANPVIPATAGGTVDFTPVGNYSDGSSAILTTGVTWTSNNVNIPIDAATGVAQIDTVGTATITANHTGGANGNTQLTVTAATLNNIIITPATANVAKGKTRQFTATGNFSDGQHDLTTLVTWASSNPGVATINGLGLATATGTSGDTNITATLSGVTSAIPAVLTAHPAEVVSMTVTPAGATVPKGKAGMPYYRDYTATGTYSDGTIAVIPNADIVWSITAGTGTATNESNRVIGTAAGTVTVKAQHTTPVTATIINAQTALTVTAPVLHSLAIAGDAAVAAGAAINNLVVTGTYSDNSTGDITNQVTWTNSNPAVGYITNGTFQSTAEGTTDLTAGLSGKTSPAHTITVTAATVTTVTVDPVGSVIAKGTTGNLRAIATKTDGSKLNVTANAATTWASDDQAVATVAAGVVTGVAKGTATISATYDGKTGQVLVTITDANLVSIDVTPNGASVAAGKTQQYTAMGTYSDTSVIDITRKVTWSTSDATIATTNQAGLVTGQAVGAANVVATLGAIVGTEGVTVTAAVLDSIIVTPANPTVTFISGAGSEPTVQFKATGVKSDGSTEDLTATAVWSVGGAGAALTATNGLIKTTGQGTATINATSGGKIGSTTLTVLADTVAPAVTIIEPKEGATTGERTVIIKGQINDLKAAVKQLVINGNTIVNLTLDGQGNFVAAVSLKDGANTIFARATDGAGNTGTSKTVTVRVDPQKPSIKIISPAGGIVTKQANVTINGTATHADNVSTVKVIVNGTSKDVAVTNGVFTTTGTLSSGINNITVTGYAKGKEGNDAYLGSSGTRTITLDATTPVVKVNTPINNSTVSIASQTITGTVDDINVTTARLTLNGGAPVTIPVVNGNFSYVANLANGLNTISVRATDAAGNESTGATLAQVTLDTSTPEVKVTAPENNLRTNSGTITITGTVNDPTISTVTLKVNGAPEDFPVEQAGDSGTFSIVKTLAAGSYTIEVTATNRAVPVKTGTSGVLGVTIDTTAPTTKINLSDPTDSIRIAVSADEDLKAAPVVEVIDSAAAKVTVDMTPDGVRQWVGTYTITKNDQYTVRAVSTDKAGNRATTTASFAKAGMAGTSSTTVNSPDTTLQVETTGDVTGDITVSTSMENPAGNTADPGDEAGFYVDINASPEILNNLSEIYIEVSYDPARLPAGTDETKLKLYLWDVASGTWKAVEGSGVDTVRKVVFATLTHLSIYGAFGAVTPTPPSTPVGGGEQPEGLYYLSSVTTADGTFTQDFTAASGDDKLQIFIEQGVVATTSSGQRLSQILISTMATPPAKPAQSEMIGLTYDLSPNGAQFDRAIRITMIYNPDELPAGFNPMNLIIAYYDSATSAWIPLDDIRVDTTAHTVSGLVTHFTPFSVVAYTTPAAFTVSDLTVTPAKVEIGATVLISAVITNTGYLAGTYQAVLSLNGETVETRDVTIEGKSSATVTFTTTRDAAGTYTVSIEGLTGSFVVVEPTVEIEPEPELKPAAFTISNLSITPAQANIGETVSISATITNTGDLAGTYKATLKLNGTIIETKDVDIEGKSSKTVTFTTTQNVAGSYTVSIEGQSGTFVIVEPTPEPVPGGMAWWVWLIIGIAVVATLGVGYLYWWKPRHAV